MILCIGIILFLGLAAWRSWQGLQSPYDWQANRIGYGGKDYYTDRIWRWTRIDIAFAIRMGSPMRFTIKPETWLDRLCKALHLATEFQLGDSAFDQHLYIVCDDAAWCGLLESNPEIQKLIRLIFLSGATELTLNGRGLYAEYKSSSSNLRVSEEELVGWLHALASHIAAFGPYAERTINSSYKLQAVILQGAHAALLVIGALGLFIAWIHSGLQFPWSALLAAALKWTLYLSVAWIVLIRLVMRSSSRSAPVVTNFAMIGLLGLFLTTASTMYDYNAEFGLQDPIVVTPQITAHGYVMEDRPFSLGRTRHRMKKVQVPTITIMPWREGQREQEQFKLTAKEYDQHMRFYFAAPQVAHHLQITYRPGALGYPWIEQYTLLDPMAKPQQPANGQGKQ